MNAVLRINRQQRANPVAVPSPVSGWNTRDSLDAMEQTDAVQLDNWFPGLGACSIRGGSASYATALGGSVKMLAEFNTGSTRKFIAGANGKIWDISSAGAAVSLATGFAADTWQWAQFDDSSGGPRMGLVNGSDAPQNYNGTAVSAMTISGTGLTPANLNGIHIHKGRSYFWDDRTQDFWYSATNALGGTMTKFPLGRLQNTGGNLICMATWSRDSGSGMQDLAVFILASGDILIYAGDSPGDVNAWQLQGRYTMGAPINKRAIRKVGSETVVVSKAGYVTLTDILMKSDASGTGKIRGAALQSVASYGTLFGWEIAHYPRKNMLLVNAPYSGTQAYQHVMNTETNAWCRFTGMNALCWGLYNDLLYWGDSSGVVRQFDTTYADSGTNITADAQTAWNYFGDRRASKRATAIRPLLRTTGGAVSYNINVGFDFRSITTGFDVSAPTVSTSAWDVSPWDTTPWADDFATSNLWSSIKGDGYAMSSRLRIITGTQGVDWFSTTYLLERGGVL